MLVAIEGIDGSGKGTQTALLEQAASSAGYRARTFSFPRYGANPFAEAVSAYLNGAFGSADSVSPYLSALLYAGDRFCAREEISTSTHEADIVVCDRYVDSNVAHQAAKLPHQERSRFVKWIEDIEYGSYAMQRPNLTVFLMLPVEVAMSLVKMKAPRSYTDRTADIHEADEHYLNACTEVYALLVDRNPDALVVDCMADGQLRSTASIAQQIWSHVRPLLGQRAESRA